jgi:hypothetical protein
MTPLGVMWGNDVDLTENSGNNVPREMSINPKAPEYARNHTGYLGRLIGPVDNPISSCLSCHSTAQVPRPISLTPLATCGPAEKMFWFRNLKGANQVFGNIGEGCRELLTVPRATSLDFSLQLAISLDLLRKTAGGFKMYFNPCEPYHLDGSAQRVFGLDSIEVGEAYPLER